MYCRRLDKLVHIFQPYRQKRHLTACRIEPIFRTIVDFFQLAESTKTLYCRALCDTKHLYHRNRLCARIAENLFGTHETKKRMERTKEVD